MNEKSLSSLSRPTRRPASLMLGSLFVAALAATAHTAHAQQGLALQGGRYDGVTSIGLQWALPDFFVRERGSWRMTAYPELQINRHAKGGDTLYQAGAFASFRFQRVRTGVRPYLEAGLGIHLLSRKTLDDKDFSTRYQFGEHLGFGVAWGGERPGGRGETWLGARFLHFSNAGLKKPNPGLEALQVILGHRF